MLPTLLDAPIAQLDRAADYGSAGYRFNSYWVHHWFQPFCFHFNTSKPEATVTIFGKPNLS